MLSPKEFIEDAIIKIKDEIGDEKTIIALSGGVDSSVCSVLTQEAIGDNLTAIFVNHGLLREGEAEQVCAVFEERLNCSIPLISCLWLATTFFFEPSEKLTDTCSV